MVDPLTAEEMKAKLDGKKWRGVDEPGHFSFIGAR